MIRNYIKTAFRSLMKNKGFTFINVFGLALGLATCLLIVFYVFDELSFDKFNTRADRIYRINNDIKFGGVENSYAVAQGPLAGALKADFPEVEQTLRLRSRGGFQVRKGNHDIVEDMMIYADSSLFNVFTLPMIVGSPSTALKESHSVVITERIAKKYFNSTDVLGKVFTFNDTAQYKITGVIQNVPKQSHFNYDFFISMSSLLGQGDKDWFSSNFNTYVLLRPGTDYKKFEAKLPEFFKKQAGPQLQAILHLDFAKFEQAGNYVHVNLTPLTKIHLESNRVAEIGSNGDISRVYLFSAIAGFILLIACVNFMNLSTARSSNRAREVGVRKVLGSPRKYLIAQFLTESILVTLVAAILAVMAALLLLPLFNQMSGKELAITPQITGWLIPVLGAIVVIIGCLAGSYPAIFLSGFNPIEVLKGKLANGFKGGLLRSSLVVFQFFISICLIIGTLIIYNQLQYIQNKDVGYNRDHVIAINNVWNLGNNAKVLKQEVQALAGIQSVSLSEALPTWNYGNSTSFFKTQVMDQKQALNSQNWSIDENYIPTLGIKMIAGRNFTIQMATDSAGLIINEAAAKILGYSNPLNQILYVPRNGQFTALKAYHIIGVIKDFNFRSLRENVTPLVFNHEDGRGALIVRAKSTDMKVLLSQIKDKWTKIAPSQTFGYSFMDDDFNALYNTEQRTGKIAVSFTSLAIIIACLGLFGLAAYAAEQRTKEIGIRKVLGANVATIVRMLSKDFIMLVIVAIVIAIPAAWWAMQTWFLRDFAYRANISWWIFAAAGVVAVIIAFVTISFQSIRAALANPVKSLKSE